MLHVTMNKDLYVYNIFIYLCKILHTTRPPYLYDLLSIWVNTASYITQDSSSESFIPISATFIEHAGLTCYTPSITFSLFHSLAQNLPVQKILSSTLVCFCLSD